MVVITGAARAVGVSPKVGVRYRLNNSSRHKVGPHFNIIPSKKCNIMDSISFGLETYLDGHFPTLLSLHTRNR